MRDNQNSILIVTRFNLNQCARDGQRLDKITVADLQPYLSATARYTDVLIIKDHNEFAVLKHRYMIGTLGHIFHVSSLPSIMFAR